VNTPVQPALATYMRDPSTYEGVAAMYRTKRDRFAQGLAGSRWRLLACEGSYFQLADYSAISDLPDLEFAKVLTREHGVGAIPLSPFYERPPVGQRLLRFCFAKQDSTLDAAIERLCRI
jgi:methionine aminotransferase